MGGAVQKLNKVTSKTGVVGDSYPQMPANPHGYWGVIPNWSSHNIYYVKSGHTMGYPTPARGRVSARKKGTPAPRPLRHGTGGSRAKFFQFSAEGTKMKDDINPAHYQRDGIECHEAIAGAVQDLTGIDAYDTGAAIKYLWRWNEKHPEDKTKDLRKAMWYIQAIIDRGEEQRLLAPEKWPSLVSTPEEEEILDELIRRQEKNRGQ